LQSITDKNVISLADFNTIFR